MYISIFTSGVPSIQVKNFLHFIL